MKIAMAADHRGFTLKEQIKTALLQAQFETVDFGAYSCAPGDDYADFVVPMAQSVGHGDIDRGIAICGSGIGASIVANKVRNVRAGLVHDLFSAQQGVEDDSMNVICLGAQIDQFPFAWELIQKFLQARFKSEPRFLRRLLKVSQLEEKELQQ